MKRRRYKKDYGLRAELRRDWETIRRLHGKARLAHLWYYYKWYFLAAVFAVIALIVSVNIIVEGQKPCRLRVCVVLNSENSCSDWFDGFEQKLTADGKPGALSVNEDQPFDYDNMYYYVQEMEVMTTVSSQRMDVAICNADMYEYLLALNACLPLDSALPSDYLSEVSDRLVQSTANLTVDEDGNIHPENGIDGSFALDLEGTAFDREYDTDEPLYAVIISNTDHVEDAIFLLKQLTTD